jgi:cytochrome c553
MKVVSLKWAIATAILAMVCSGVGRADDLPERSQSKIGYCTDCHGSSGQGYSGYYSMPRLAGQTTEYLVRQLRAFAEGSRDRNIGINMSRVHGLSPGMRTALAIHFRGLNPRPFGRGPQGLVAEGKKIYEEGVPEANVPACAACHGPDAKGNGENPRLAGQLYSYTVKVMVNWDRERGQHDDKAAVMQPTLRNITKSQISAVAAYVSGLK